MNLWSLQRSNGRDLIIQPLELTLGSSGLKSAVVFFYPPLLLIYRAVLGVAKMAHLDMF